MLPLLGEDAVFVVEVAMAGSDTRCKRWQCPRSVAGSVLHAGLLPGLVEGAFLAAVICAGRAAAAWLALIAG